MKLIFIKNFLNICQYKAVPKSLTRMVQCYYKGEQLFYQIVAQNLLQSDTIESSHPKDYHKKDIFKCFTKFTWIHLCRSLFLVALQAFRSRLIIERLWHWCFTVNFVKFLRTSILHSSFVGLLLKTFYRKVCQLLLRDSDAEV